MVGGVRVTTPARTAAVCANSMPFMPAMEVMCWALRNGTSSTEIIACATREGLLNAPAQSVFRFATPFAENGGEARAFAAMILCGFEPPAQQVEFTDPQTGKRYRVDVIVRIRMDDLHDLEGLKQRLARVDVPLRRR